MKKVGKKLKLEKFNVTKLSNMSIIKGGHLRSERPGCEVFNKTKKNCDTKEDCPDPSGPTIIVWG